jgi:hypothetical protein
MNKKMAYISVYVITGMLGIAFVVCAGCSSSGANMQPAAVNVTPSATVLPSLTPTTLPPTTTPLPTTSIPPTPTPVLYQSYSDPTYPLTMNYPSGWAETQPGDCSPRDFGRTSCNIVNFYMPNATIATCRTFSIDVDTTPGTDLEGYFNNATLALEKTYQPLTSTSPNSLYHVSGYQAYRLDFIKPDNSPEMEVFTITPDKIAYIFTYNGTEDTDFQIMMQSVNITSSTNSTATG